MRKKDIPSTPHIPQDIHPTNQHYRSSTTGTTTYMEESNNPKRSIFRELN